MTHLMCEITIERLATFELSFFRNDNLILTDRVICIITVSRFDWANPLVFSNHVVNGRESKHFTFLLDSMSDLILLLKFLEKFRTCLLNVRLSLDIEDIVSLQFGVNIVFGTLFLRKTLVIVILDTFLCFRINASKGCDEHRETLGSLIYRNLWKFVAFAISGILLGSLLILHIVQSSDTVEGCPYW